MINSKDIALLRPDVADGCRACMRIAKDMGVPFIVTSTVRDEEYQNQLYRQGRDLPGKIVTMLKRPGFHWNVAALAFDFCPVDAKGKALWDRTDLFKVIGNIGKFVGFEWGGDWKGFVDMPHLQWSQGGKYTTEMIWAKNFPPKLPLKLTVKFPNLTSQQKEAIKKFVEEKGYKSKEIPENGGSTALCFPFVATLGECESIMVWGSSLGSQGVLSTDK